MPQHALRTQQSPDLPDVLLHMSRRWGKPSPGLQEDIVKLDPVSRLAGILVARRIRWGIPFDTTWPVVCFTQTTRRALRQLSSRYAHAGLAFHKQTVWSAGGGPVYYIRGDNDWTVWKTAEIPEPMRSRGVRLWPGWDGDVGAESFFSEEVRGASEWLHEREWRIPRSEDGDQWGWSFKPGDVRFLVLPTPAHLPELLATVERWKGDVDWVRSLPLAYPSADGAGFDCTDPWWV